LKEAQSKVMPLGMSELQKGFDIGSIVTY